MDMMDGDHFCSYMGLWVVSLPQPQLGQIPPSNYRQCVVQHGRRPSDWATDLGMPSLDSWESV